jgi:hypothetical protein
MPGFRSEAGRIWMGGALARAAEAAGRRSDERERREEETGQSAHDPHNAFIPRLHSL